MNTKAKLNERLEFSDPDEWVPMANFDQVVAVGVAYGNSPVASITVQLRKATDSSGSDADDLGSSVQADQKAVAQAYAEDLGETSGGTAFTHVQATVTGAENGVVIRGSGRFNP